MQINGLNINNIHSVKNIEIDIISPILNNYVYDIPIGDLIYNKIIFYKDNYYWFYFLKYQECIYICSLISNDGLNWSNNSSFVDNIENAILKIKTEYAIMFLNKDELNILYLSYDKKNRLKYQVLSSADIKKWDLKNFTIDFIGFIYDIVLDKDIYSVYFTVESFKNVLYLCQTDLLNKLNKNNIDKNVILESVNDIINMSCINLLGSVSYFYNVEYNSKNKEHQHTYIKTNYFSEKTHKYYFTKENNNMIFAGLIKRVNNHDYSYFGFHLNNGDDYLMSARNLSDKWISLKTKDNFGYIETDFIVLQNHKQLFANINSCTSADSYLKIGLKDKNDNFLKDYSLKDCIPLNGDTNRQMIAWGEKAYIKVEEPIIVKMLIELKNINLFYLSLENFSIDCAANSTIQIKSKEIKYDNLWWDSNPIIVFSGCEWQATGAAQRPVALSREFAKLGHPIIYCSYASKNSTPIFVDGVFIVPAHGIEDFIDYLRQSNIIGICMVTLANYYQYAAILEQVGWKVIYDLLDDWDAFFEYKELLADPHFKEQELIGISSHIVCSASALVERAIKLSSCDNISLIRNGGIKTLHPRTIPSSDMLSYKDPLSIYCGYLAGKWIDWSCFEILLQNNILTNVVGEVFNFDKKYLFPEFLNNRNGLKFLNGKPFNEALNYIAASHVGLIPFQHEKICRSVDPIKLYDYWAAGLWTIATPVLTELENREYTIVADKQDWPKAIQEAYTQMKKGNCPSEEFVYNNSWESRARDYNEIIKTYMPKKDKVYRVTNRPYLKDSDYKLRLTVEAPSSCNMKPYCPYCANAESRDHRNEDFHGDVNKWLANLTWLSEEYGPLYLTSCYGEPLSSLESIRLYAELARGNMIDIVSNIIAPIEHIQLLPNNGNVRFATSFHPHYWDIDSFIEKRIAIQDLGYHCGVSLIVAYPPYIPFLEEWKKKLEDIGSSVEILTFYGMFQGKNYPDNYTKKEKEIVLSYQNNFNNREDSELVNKTKGKKCWAGCKYIFINWEGDVMQCPAHGVRKLGNILERDFELFDKPQPCIADFCGCADMWKYIEEE